jgi:hypothetical protein
MQKEGGGKGASSDSVVDKVINRLKKIVKAGEDKGVKPDKAFEHFDTTGAGSVDADDFISGLDRLKMAVTPVECKQVCVLYTGQVL